MKVLLRRDAAAQRVEATWAPIPLHPEGRTASILCPTCGKEFDLFEYEIGEDGSVLLPVLCPFSCGFHEILKLDGWKATA